jgi:hypothetical protein
MNDYYATGSHETSATSGPQASFPNSSTSVTTAKHAGRSLLTKKSAWIAPAAVLCAVVGLSACSASSNSATTTSPSATSPSSSAPAGHGMPGGPGAGGGSNARSGPAAGGSVGTVSSMSGSSFTLSTVGGQKVTVNETSSTTYQNGTSSASASASSVTTGEPVLVLGTVNSTTITATQITVQPPGGDGSATAKAAGVVAFQQGTPSPSKQVGQVPTNYTEGSGTIVSGSTANQATDAALAAYPGGIVDRVVQLSNGEYEVHNIGCNWPHHIFVSTDFKVLGAE